MPINEETITVRVPKGMSEKVRAATGRKISPLVRQLLEGVLRQYEERARKDQSDD